MPTYRFKNKTTGKEWDENGSLLAKKDYKLINLIKKLLRLVIR